MQSFVSVFMYFLKNSELVRNFYMIQRGLMIVYLKIDSPRVKKTNEDEFDPKLSKLFYWRGVDLKGRSICKFL